MLLRNQVILWLNTPCLAAAIAAARDMRACTRTVSITPNFFLAHGPAGLRCLYELGISDVLLDMRLCGSPKEIWQCVLSAAKHGIKAVSISALAGKRNIEYAIAAAEASKKETLKVQRPYIFIAPLPTTTTDKMMVSDLRMRVQRPGHIKQVVRLVLETGADAALIEYDDLKNARSVSKEVQFLMFAQRHVRNYAEVEREDERGKPGVTEILRAGACHAIVDSEFLRRTDIEWAADMLNKELAEVGPPPVCPTYRGAR
jgi:orotidine-5'-phosphate decarboxylase